ncbi:MAG: hypothetical protein Q9218_005841 [Villophora microphyllina]
MSTPRRQSPRAKIREWLAQTDHVANVEAKYDSKRKQRQEKPKDHSNLAEQLGLHAPFRTFATRGADAQPSLRPRHERHKRRRSHSLASSYLEPAIHINDGDETSDPSLAVQAKRPPLRENNHDRQMPSRSSSPAIASLHKPAKSYERRSRHKTKEDRYELKVEKKRNKIRESKDWVADKPKKKKQKHARKSGAALMQGFNAGNVEPERLTLKSNLPLGLFGRGRASSPVRRQGLPDLTFSEINFLNHRKGGKEEKPGNVRKKPRQKRDRNADTEAEFSRFFAASKVQDPKVRATTIPSKGLTFGRSGGERSDEVERPSPPQVDLPERPFLGFGSCGPGHDSPVLLARASASRADSHVPDRRRPPSGKSTTYFTWSHSSVSENTRYGDLTHHPRQIVEGDARLQQCPDRGLSDHGRGPEPRIDPDIRLVSCTPSNRSYGLREYLRHENAEDLNTVAPFSRHGHEKGGFVHLHRTEPTSEEQPKQHLKQQHGQHDPVDHSAANVGCTDSNIASVLAAHDRPELLGAVLDALLSKMTTQDLKSKLGIKTPISACDERQDDDGSLQHNNHTQTTENSKTAIDPDGLPVHPDSADRAHTMPGSGLGRKTQEPQQAASAVQQADGQNLCRKFDRKAPDPVQKDYRSYGLPQMLHSDVLTSSVPQTVNARPDSSNAWTGYNHLYEGQCNEGNLDYQIHDGVMQHDVDRAYCSHDQIIPQSDQLPQDLSTALECGDAFVRDQSYQHDSDSRHFAEDMSLHSQYQSPQMQGSLKEMFEQPQARTLSAEQVLQEGTPLHTRSSGILWPKDSITEPSFYDGSSNVERLDLSSFLGGRGFAMADYDQSHPSWKPQTRPLTRDGGRFFTPSNNVQDVKRVEEMLLSKFWKPQRLY